MIYGTGVKHVARFWLRSPDDLREIERRVAELATLPQVIDMIIGPPLDTDWSGRLDTSYDLAFIATFESRAACLAYYEAERHQRIAGELQKIAGRIEAFYVAY
jgi:stress responsive alpha/beta barrel protein